MTIVALVNCEGKLQSVHDPFASGGGNVHVLTSIDALPGSKSSHVGHVVPKCDGLPVSHELFIMLHPGGAKAVFL
jgi:hypothetical protein